MHNNLELVAQYMRDLQDRLCVWLESLDQQATFEEDQWEKHLEFGGKTRILKEGAIFEQAGINYSLVGKDTLPAAATKKRTDLSNRPFRAVGVSLVFHPRNPYLPTTHMNVRFFTTYDIDKKPVWWFGGGFDLTPYYGFEEDAISWHRTAKKTCDPFGSEVYSHYKKWCDDYFYLPHRDEQRGIGGVFFDDLNTWSFDTCFQFVKAIAEGFQEAYEPIVQKRSLLHYGERERNFQLYRRGRYVEFNLLHDRGTLFGLQSGGRTESILMSLPPLVRFSYRYKSESGSKEEALFQFIKRREWI